MQQVLPNNRFGHFMRFFSAALCPNFYPIYFGFQPPRLYTAAPSFSKKDGLGHDHASLNKQR